jgi:type I restriction enzyme S subunit
MIWNEIQIKDIGKVITGNTPPKNDSENYGGIYPFLKPTDMNIGERYTFLNDEFYSEKAFERYKKSYIPPLSTCVVTIGTIGEKMCLTHNWCFTNQSVNSVIPNFDKYDGMFIFYLLKYNLYQVKNANAGTSSGREHVNKTTFSNIKVNVPNSIKTQKRIASILSAYDDLIENNLKRIKLLEETAQNIYKEWFVNFRFPNYEHTAFDTVSGLPVGWRKGKVSDLCDVKSGYAFKSKHWQSEGNPVMKIKNITNNTVDIIDCDYVDDEVAKNAEKFELFEGDVLIAMTGATVGKVGLIPKIDKRIYINQRVGLFRPNSEVVNNVGLIFTFFMTDDGLKQILNFAGGAAQPNISSNQISNVELNIATVDILVKFNNSIQPLLKQIQTLYFQNQKLKEARDILLPRLMNRTIEV